MHGELAAILGAADRAAVEVMPLKGALLTRCPGPTRPAGRWRDLDLLVRPADRGRIARDPRRPRLPARPRRPPAADPRRLRRSRRRRPAGRPGGRASGQSAPGRGPRRGQAPPVGLGGRRRPDGGAVAGGDPGRDPRTPGHAAATREPARPSCHPCLERPAERPRAPGPVARPRRRGAGGRRSWPGAPSTPGLPVAPARSTGASPHPWPDRPGAASSDRCRTVWHAGRRRVRLDESCGLDDGPAAR